MAESYPGLVMGLYECGMGKAENRLELWRVTLGIWSQIISGRPNPFLVN